MKTIYFYAAFAFLFLRCGLLSFAQGVSINNAGSPPDPSAGLDVSFDDKGVLISRMTTAQRDAIVDPAEGLLIYNTSTGCVNMWLGSTWKKLCGDCDFANPTPGNSGPVCEGEDLSLTATSVGEGATYQWSGPNGFTSAVQNPTLSDVSILSSGSYSVSATLNGCESSLQTTVVTVNPIPDAPEAAISGPVCQGGNLQLTATAISGATYSWTGPDGFISSSQNPVVSGMQASKNGIYSVVATVNGCDSESDGIEAIAFNPVSSFSWSAPTWPATPVVFNPTVESGASYNWTFTSGTPSSSTLQSPSVTWSSAGTYNASLTITIHGCSSSTTQSVAVTDPTVVSFTNVGTTSWTAPEGVNAVEVLVVAGGGSGSGWGGGGGAGGIVHAEGFPVVPGNSYPVTVGAGGTSVGVGGSQGINGNNSEFATLVAIGGGGGGGYDFGNTGKSGGSGGGADPGYWTNGALGGAALQPGSVSGGFGNAGGNSAAVNGNYDSGGGGGGAGGAGSPGNSGAGGDGGIGLPFSITGSVVYYGGGGSGRRHNQTVSHGVGGLGGGGTAGGPGSPNTGGGGAAAGGAGGSGIVILKY